MTRDYYTMADSSLEIPQVAPFKPDVVDPTSVSQRWKCWSDRFDNLGTMLLLGINPLHVTFNSK